MRIIAIALVLVLAGCKTPEQRQAEQEERFDRIKDASRSNDAWRQATGSSFDQK